MADRKNLPAQQQVATFYNGINVQVFVAFLISANFLTNIVEKEIDPKAETHADGSRVYGEFVIFELVYNIAFTIELAVNIYAHWFREFWRSKWNIFDCVVVSIGLINMSIELPKSLSLLRMMRAFRVFRLFKRVKSLNKIIVAIVHAVPGVSNAFLILAIVMAIYAILSVALFSKNADDCFEPGGDARFQTARGGCHGPEYFGTFSRSFYTFFQVLTGESWSEWVARPVIWYISSETGTFQAVCAALFFCSYVGITAFVLINVVVAVLLDKMSAPEEEEEAPEDKKVDIAASTGEEVSQADANSNGEYARPIQAEFVADGSSSKANQLKAVQEQVGQLLEDRKKMCKELDTLKDNTADMKQKLAQIMKFVSD